LFDIDVSDQTACLRGAMTGDQTALHFLIRRRTSMEQVRRGPIRRFGPDVGPNSIHEKGRLRRLRDRAVIAKTLGTIIWKIQLGASLKGVEPAIEGIAPKHQIRAGIPGPRMRGVALAVRTVCGRGGRAKTDCGYFGLIINERLHPE